LWKPINKEIFLKPSYQIQKSVSWCFSSLKINNTENDGQISNNVFLVKE